MSIEVVILFVMLVFCPEDSGELVENEKEDAAEVDARLLVEGVDCVVKGFLDGWYRLKISYVQELDVQLVHDSLHFLVLHYWWLLGKPKLKLL